MPETAATRDLMASTAIQERGEPQESGAPNDKPRRMMTEEEVRQLVRVSRTTLYRMEKAGEFPRSTYISPNRRRWFEDDIVAWQREVDGRRRGRVNHPGEAT
jgi:prophage regulatory protein